MVTDRNNDRYVLVDREGQVQAHGAPGLKRPHNCEPLEGGQVIIANSDNNSVDIVDAAGQVVWRYDEGLLWPRDANRLPDGNVLIADSKNSRVIEVTPGKEMVWSFAVDYFANFYEAHRLPNGHTLISDQQRQQVLEVDGDGQVVWRFRNYERSGPLLDRLQNGSFKHTDGDGLPSDWILATRLSEGGGRLIWGEDPRGKRIPGMEYDRPGALYFQQAVRVQPGAYYTLAGRIGTENLDGVACLQVAFIDEYDALLCDASLSPRGEGFSGTTPLTDDMFEMEVPERAVAANVRIFMSGTGKVFFDQIRFFC